VHFGWRLLDERRSKSETGILLVAKHVTPWLILGKISIGERNFVK